MSEPTTAAGQLHIKHWHPYGQGTHIEGALVVADLDLAEDIFAIEAEARAAALDEARAAVKATVEDGYYHPMTDRAIAAIVALGGDKCTSET